MKSFSRSFLAILLQSWTVFAQGRDCGSFTMSCAGAEGACNNACYHITCLAPTNANRVTYIGNGNSAENDRNRQQSGCTAATGGSVCRNFPFSQNFIDDANRHLIAANDCDEWPPAASQQDDFAAGTIRNSLRCIPSGENRAAGARLGNFINDVGPGRQNRNPTCAGPLNRDDYFTVDFDLTNADQTKLKFCQPGGTVVCGQDGFQFHMTEKPTQNGKISSFYDPFGTDNRYQLSAQTVATELLQCSIFISRPDDNTFNWRVTDSGNRDVNTGQGIVTGATGTFTADGLPNDLVVGKTGPNFSLLTFQYGVQNMDPDYLTWTTSDIGDGRGPATNVGMPYNYCHETTGPNGESQSECWFGCYE